MCGWIPCNPALSPATRTRYCTEDRVIPGDRMLDRQPVLEPPHPESCPLQVHTVAAERDCFRHAQPVPVHHQHQQVVAGAVPCLLGALEQPLHLAHQGAHRGDGKEEPPAGEAGGAALWGRQPTIGCRRHADCGSMGTRTAVARSTLRWRRGSTPKPKMDLCTASHANGAKHLGTAQLVLRSRSKMYTLVSGRDGCARRCPLGCRGSAASKAVLGSPKRGTHGSRRGMFSILCRWQGLEHRTRVRIATRHKAATLRARGADGDHHRSWCGLNAVSTSRLPDDACRRWIGCAGNSHHVGVA
jgi:hypothetical protein